MHAAPSPFNPPDLPQALSAFSEGFYLSYPHANSFLDDQSLVLGRVVDGHLELVIQNLADNSRRPLGQVTLASGITAPPYDPQQAARKSSEVRAVFWDVARAAQSPTVIVGDGTAFYRIDASTNGKFRIIHRAEPGIVLTTQPSISADGRRVLIGYRSLETPEYGALEWNAATEDCRALITKTWWANHFHYCPHDEAWIGLCHEGPCASVPDRVWAWHASLSPEGISLFDQRWEKPEERLYVGHERWCFHTTSVVAVAYGESPARPRGIYEIFPNRTNRLISEGERDWHVDVSRDGRWAVVDTTGPTDAPGSGWENAELWSDIVLIDMQSGDRQFLARTRHIKHPSHPHPVFSPDGRFVVYNDVDETLAQNRVALVANPWASPTKFSDPIFSPSLTH